MPLDGKLLQSSLELVSGREELVTARFYDVLFERHPSVRPLFGADVRPQAAMLQESIVAVLDHLEEPDWLQEHLHALGARHVGYGATADLYPLVAACLIDTMAQIGGDDWTPAMSDAWATALTAVATLMLEGAAETSTPSA